MILLGQLFLGKSFDALKNDKPPAYVHHLDNAYLVWAISGIFPLTYKFMSFLPFKSVKEFLAAGDYVYDVSSLSFDWQFADTNS